jgi:hypothetical protein
MKCLSLIQPYATLVVHGRKRYETRSWRTDHRGLFAIHASRRFPEPLRQACFEEPYRYFLQHAGYRYAADLPLGAVIGSVELLDCLPAEEVRAGLSEEELFLGNFSAGRWAWVLANPRVLACPVPLSGRLGLFEIHPLLELR